MKIISKPDPFDVALWGLVIAFGVGVVYYYQLRAMQDSNRITRDALQSVQRAFVVRKSYDTPKLLRHEADGDHYEYAVKAFYENTGTTPAINAIQCLQFDKLPNEPTEDQFHGVFSGEHKSCDLMPFSISPKDEPTSNIVRKPEAFIWGEQGESTAKKRIVRTMTTKIFAWGWVIYRDVFNGTPYHITEYCHQLTNIMYTIPDTGGLWVWGNCEHHNCVDEYCSDYATFAEMVPKAN